MTGLFLAPRYKITPTEIFEIFQAIENDLKNMFIFRKKKNSVLANRSIKMARFLYSQLIGNQVFPG